ncbi:outer membrane protein assembly factor BamB family protein [Deminuibacter soli]|uniref:Pyrroloquinoline quinone-dependent dehydrogenase n=1 Tax=Deminuibacter soli TaxID=2291815 RepID=A0A3E1NM66_9BACT|nr:PQQ-binding-like beta-propeller repeat protein [Deminuibacter soli]RFM29019.1 pyrroloquinoline quinone-dependent dehydrogenase [Deminuibacter soli]
MPLQQVSRQPFLFYKRSFFILCAAVAMAACGGKQPNSDQWNVYGGNKAGTRYSSLTQIDTGNVQQLAVAWTYHTHDADTVNHSQIQCNPIIVDNVLYGSTPQQKIFALDAATGKQKWVFDPLDKKSGDASFFVMNNIRGVSYWASGDDKRILFTAGAYLYAISATDGKPIPAFGNKGRIDLHDGLGRDVSQLFVTNTSPGIIYKDLIITGTRVDEGANAAPGHIRAYDVRTGKQQWIFHTIPQPGEPGYETWEDPNAWKHIGGANCWSGFTLDEQKGIVFAAVGSASYDFYGGMRKGANLYADCMLALDAATGKLVWHFQDIHHDLWDKDIPTPPALVTIQRDGKNIEAVAQPTKTGYVFVLDRATGKPLYDVKEVPVPTVSDLKGEKVYPTQPMPVLPKPFARQHMSEEDINPLLSAAEQDSLKKVLQSLHHDNMFDPPSQTGTLIFPGYDGGAEWSGPAFDQQTGLLYVNANEMPWILHMKEVKAAQQQAENWLQAGQRLYQTNCITCHGPERKGGGNYPSLVEANKKYNALQLDTLLLNGRRMMPAFRQLSLQERQAIASFILDNKKAQATVFTGPKAAPDSFLQLPYAGTGYIKFLAKDGTPAIRPPWGTLSAINLNTGNIDWQIPLGQTAAGEQHGVVTGTENYGGPAVTAGGLVFIAATSDAKIRAFNKHTGKLLWEHALPASGFATPAVYAVNGKQYVVIACGGGKLHTSSGDSYVAFSIPDKK